MDLDRRKLLKLAGLTVLGLSVKPGFGSPFAGGSTGALSNG